MTAVVHSRLDQFARIAQRCTKFLAQMGHRMAIDKLVAPLLRVPLFVGLRPLQITEIARQAERIAFRSGGIITEAGRPGDGAYLIVSGDAAYKPRPGSAVPPQPVEPGSLVGELAMLVDHIYSATIVADGRVHCLKILRAALYAQMEADPALAHHLSGALTERLTEIAMEMRRIDGLLAPGIAEDPVLDPPPMPEVWPRTPGAETQR